MISFCTSHAIADLSLGSRIRRAAQKPEHFMMRLEGGDGQVGNPAGSQSVHFMLFELALLLKAEKQFSVERCEATASQLIS